MSERQRPCPTPSSLVRAAGAVVWRFRSGYGGIQPRIGQIIDSEDIEVLIVHRPRYNDWSWPKGKTENGELLAAAAVREVEEETGEVIMLGAPLTLQRYRLGNGQTKEVHYWVGRQAAGNPASRLRPPVVRASSKEIDDCRWVSVAEASAMLTRRGDRRLLSEVVTLAETGALVTAPLLVMRPAETVERERWEGIVAERHLTRVGVRQSLDVIDTLAAFCVQSIHASEWWCAHRSVAPYASAAGLPIRTHAELTEPSVMADPSIAVDMVRGVMGNLQTATLVAANRAVLGHIVEAMRCSASPEVRALFPTEEPWLRPAELLVAHIGTPLVADRDSNTVTEMVSVVGEPAGEGHMRPRNVEQAQVDSHNLQSRPAVKPGPHLVAAASMRQSERQRRVQAGEGQVGSLSAVVASTGRGDVAPVRMSTAPRQIIAIERHTIPGGVLYKPEPFKD